MIQEAQSFELSKEDITALKDLKGSKQWEKLKKVCEGYILKLTANLISGTELEPGLAGEELKAVRGFVRFWTKIKNLIENQDE